MTKYTNENNIPSALKDKRLVVNELKKNRFISLRKIDSFLLYLANSMGSCFPNKLWSKKKKLQRLYEEGNDRIEAKLNIVKIAKHQTDVKVLLRNSMLSDDILY